MEQLNIKSIFSISNEDLKKIQLRAADKLNELFILKNIKNFKYEVEKFEGVRGYYLDRFNLVISYYFDYLNYFISIHLYYDQMEYYISKNGKILKECNLEDYTEDENEMADTFIKYLKKDLNKLKIPIIGQNGA
jgi:hypothetical protein